MAAAPESPTPAPTGSSTSLLRTGLSRRGVVRTAMWSVPAVTLATAAPAYAASAAQIAVTPQTARWDDSAEASPQNPNAQGGGSALFGSIWIESLEPTTPTPTMTMTMRFPDSWTEAGPVSIAHEDVGMDLGYGLGWVPAEGTPGTNGLLTSASGVFTFTHTGGFTFSDGYPGFDFRFSAWVEGVSLLRPVGAAYDDIIVDFAVVGTEWGLVGGTSYRVPVDVAGLELPPD